MESVQTLTHTPDNKTFDYLIAFGEGPIRPILLYDELTDTQRREWSQYREDPITTPDPEFWCMQAQKHLKELQKVNDDSLLSDTEKKLAREKIRSTWQQNGNYAMKQWGKQNALAVGYALYKGRTQYVILSGGQTKPDWVTAVLPDYILKQWPSEAYLMMDIIVNSYGNLYERKYGRKIREVIQVEDTSTNTLENFAYTINNIPALLHPETTVAFVSANHHLKRIQHLAQLFSLKTSEDSKYSAQQLLNELSEDGVIEVHPETQIPSKDIVTLLTQSEERWLRGLEDPAFLTYWVGYLGLVDHPKVIEKAFKRIETEDSWRYTAIEKFKVLGIAFEDYMHEDLSKMRSNDPDKYYRLIKVLETLRQPTHRVLPPIP